MIHEDNAIFPCIFFLPAEVVENDEEEDEDDGADHPTADHPHQLVVLRLRQLATYSYSVDSETVDLASLI